MTIIAFFPVIIENYEQQSASRAEKKIRFKKYSQLIHTENLILFQSNFLKKDNKPMWRE